MAIFVCLSHYAEDGELYGYFLFSTTLALVVLGLFLLLKKEWSTHYPTKLPIVGIESPGYIGLVKARLKFVSNGFSIVKSGYYKYRGKNFVVTTHGYDRIILTHDQVKELSNAPNDIISIQHATVETLLGEYTGLDRFLETYYVEEVVRIKLKQNLGNIKEAILEETRFALEIEMPECSTDEWKSIEIFTPILRTVARMSSRAFVGLPLCRNEDWLTISIMFTTDLFQTVTKLTSKHKLIRPLFAYMWDSAKSIRSHKQKADTLLAPIIRKRFEDEKHAEKGGTAYKKPNDMLQWLTDRVEPQHKTSSALSELLLLIGLASIHTTAVSFVNALYDLAAHQECIQPIREEIEAVLFENGGVLDRAALRKMKKTDSFFKEAMRVRANNLFSFSRKVLKSITLSDGTYLPKGALLAAPTSMFSTDPEIVEDPATFDSFRWYKRSLQTEGSAIYHNNWTATSSKSLTFGHGKHACPGRFFATEEMKIILTFIILQYDIKYPEGQSRPDSFDYGEFTFPDTTKPLLFKKLPGPKKFSFL